MGFYKHHVFFCTNVRDKDSDRASCGRCGSAQLRAYAKERIKALGMKGQGGVRINTAGCLDRCEEGPACVVYPEGIWYTFVDEEDIDEIIDEHLVAGRPVARLTI